ncbi:hypothetical protein FOZ62_030809 [Perkinsus olseni]|uniref:Uncharacterized protein n=1 Tax=Perkinsus olseni TaxID=32597 RepID=A0A7J6QYY2_PEROL|nr:hypothetical protein FOZ62_030809 [Perkinsus olseni]
MAKDVSSRSDVDRFFADFDLGPVEQVSSGDFYFNSYSHREAYEELLKDEVHQEAYRTAILANKHLFRDRVVLVVECGLGLAPYLVAEAGAKTVLAQEKNLIGRHIPRIARLNGHDNIVSVLGDIADPDFALPYGLSEVDVIVSEPMGYLLLHESRIRDVIVARDRFLKPGGKMFPSRFTMNLCAVAAPQEHSLWMDFWEDVQGFDFSDPCQRLTMGTPLISAASQLGSDKDHSSEDAWQRSQLTSTPAELFAIDLMTAPPDVTTRPEFLCGEFELFPRPESGLDEEDTDTPDAHWWRADERSCTDLQHRVDALVVWFDVKFDHAHVPVEYSTGPEAPWTLWQQTILRLPPPSFTGTGAPDCRLDASAMLQPGRTLRGRMALRQASADRRDIDIKLSMEDGRGGSINTLSSFGARCGPLKLFTMLIDPVFVRLPVVDIARAELRLHGNDTTSVLRLRLLLERLQCRSSVAAGSIHSACLHDGRAYTFGTGTSGQLGHGVFRDEPRPLLVASLNHRTVAAVACGDRHTLFLCTPGVVFGTGRNTFGQLASDDLRDFPSPRKIDVEVPSSTPIDVRCGGDHSMVLLANGHVVAFGWNAFGQLGIGVSAFGASPVAAVSSPTLVHPPAPGIRFVSVSCGFAHSLFLSDSGRVYSCGMGSHGQLGNNDRSHRWVPTFIPTIDRCTMVSCGGHHSLVLCDPLGEVYAFGSGSTGKLGRGDDMGDSAIPVKVSGQLPPVASVCCGGAHSLVITRYNSALYGFGMGRRGQLGDGQRRSHPLPTGPVASGVQCMAGGGYHTIAALDSGGIIVFGRSTRGQLGLGFVEDVSVPWPLELPVHELHDSVS